MLLENRVAFVTGAGSGIGAAGAEALAREGALAIVTDKNADAASAVATRITDAGGTAKARMLDVTEDDALATAIEEVARDEGRLDILHSHAGVQIESKLEQVPVTDMDLEAERAISLCCRTGSTCTHAPPWSGQCDNRFGQVFLHYRPCPRGRWRRVYLRLGEEDHDGTARSSAGTERTKRATASAANTRRILSSKRMSKTSLQHTTTRED